MFRRVYSHKAYRVYPGSSCARFVERRDVLEQLLRDQIVIAEKLERAEGSYSRDVAFAWDVVEEVSRKLRLIEMHIDDLYYEERGYERAFRDDEISMREYDV